MFDQHHPDGPEREEHTTFGEPEAEAHASGHKFGPAEQPEAEAHWGRNGGSPAEAEAHTSGHRFGPVAHPETEAHYGKIGHSPAEDAED